MYECIISVFCLRPASHCDLNEQILTNTNNNSSDRIGTNFDLKCSRNELCLCHVLINDYYCGTNEMNANDGKIHMTLLDNASVTRAAVNNKS